MVNVSSTMANTCMLDMTDPQLAKPGAWSGVRAYSQSKLCQVCQGMHVTPLLSLCYPCLQLKETEWHLPGSSASFALLCHNTVIVVSRGISYLRHRLASYVAYLMYKPSVYITEDVKGMMHK